MARGAGAVPAPLLAYMVSSCEPVLATKAWLRALVETSYLCVYKSVSSVTSGLVWYCSCHDDAQSSDKQWCALIPGHPRALLGLCWVGSRGRLLLHAIRKVLTPDPLTIYFVLASSASSTHMISSSTWQFVPSSFIRI